MSPSSRVPFGDGWVTTIEPAPDHRSITDALEAIRTSSLQARHEADVGALRLGPAGPPPGVVTAIDGTTELPVRPQHAEFLSYARWWRNSILLGQVLDPDDLLDHLTDPRLGLDDVMSDEFDSPGVLVDAHGDALDPARCVLLALDTLQATPYRRTYLVFDVPAHSRTPGGRPDEPEVWGFESEHVHAPDLRSYLVAAARTGLD